MKNYILLSILLLTTTIKAITYPSTWGTDRIFLYDLWDKCGQPAALVTWGDVTKDLAQLNGNLGISIFHPATGTGNNYYKVTKIIANNRGFVGQIPAGIENLTELTHFQVSGSTGLTGVIPACFASFQKLDYLNMKNCNFTGMAAPLTKLPKTQLELQYNKIPFGDLLPMKNLARTAPGASAYSYDYLPQNAGLIVSSNTKEIANGAQLSLDIDVLLPNHGGTTFVWYLNNVQVGTGKTYTVTMSNSTAGAYKCGITTDTDMLNSATCPTSSWATARTYVYPTWAITNNTENINVTLATATSILKNNAETVKVWTNNSKVYVSNITPNAKIEVIDLFGKTIVTSGTKEISDGLFIPVKGTYLLRIKQDLGNTTMKIIL